MSYRPISIERYSTFALVLLKYKQNIYISPKSFEQNFSLHSCFEDSNGRLLINIPRFPIVF
jgi:hypothetical protein